MLDQKAKRMLRILLIQYEVKSVEVEEEISFIIWNWRFTVFFSDLPVKIIP